MRRKTNLSIKPKYVLIACSGICVVFMLTSFLFAEKMQPVKGAVSQVISPMQNGINLVGAFITEKTEMFTTMKALQKENKELKEKVDTLSSENKILQLDKYELNSLRELYKLDQKYTEYPKVAARITSKDTGNWFNVFKIDKGSNDGLKPGMNVMAGDGLVGIVTEVNHNNSTVRSIIDDRSSVNAMFMKTSDNCFVNGNLELIGDGLMEMTDINIDADIKKGYEVVTSRISSKYLPGILIGYVEKVENDASNLTKSGYITPAVNFDKLDTVLVITELKEADY